MTRSDLEQVAKQAEELYDVSRRSGNIEEGMITGMVLGFLKSALAIGVVVSWGMLTAVVGKAAGMAIASGFGGLGVALLGLGVWAANQAKSRRN